jgi:hypothetical protein
MSYRVHGSQGGRGRTNVALAVVAAVVGTVLAVVRSRRTGVEVWLIAVALLLFGLRDLGAGPRRYLRGGAWLALIAVAAIALEPHLH